ncbi:MAG: ribonuclease Z [Cytophagales bacterium]|nr:ribonuclease Z [Cytophagales bacterium]
MSAFKLTILGSSGALPAYGRFTSSQYLSVQQHHFLIDCGEGCQQQLKRYELSTFKLNHIFVSHLHGDHYLGLMGLLFSMHLLHREHDLHLYSFRGLEEIILTQLKHSRSVLRFRILFHSLRDDEPVLLFEDEILSIHSIPLDHKIPTCGFLFREKEKSRRIDKSKLPGNMLIQHIAKLRRGEDVYNEANELLYACQDYTLPPRPSRSYAYCSDSQPNAQILPVIEGVDLLYHEATFLEDEKEKARQTKHSTAAEAADIARRGQVKRLLIGHFSARYRDLGPVLEEARKIFPATSLAIEGESFEITE